MEIKAAKYKIIGMSRDLSQSAFNSEVSFENQNIRITANENDTLFSVTNEKGPLYTNLFMTGKCIGYCNIGDYVVFFTTNTQVSYKSDYIYLYSFGKLDILYNGNLNFSEDYPIESLGFYESEDVQKVYWVDGRNQMRVINIKADGSSYTDSSFDFVKKLNLDEEVIVDKMSLGGQFPMGTIQYAFTYYNKFSSETNIFYITPLYYTSKINSGGSPEEISNNSFKISISGIDTSFEYLRIYSIMRTTLNGEIRFRQVYDHKIEVGYDFTYVDNGYSNQVDLDPTLLFYIGGEELIAGTITAKDNTLFAGNIELKRPILNDANLSFTVDLKGDIRNIEIENNSTNTSYPYKPEQLNRSEIEYTRHWKEGETYRWAIQAQHESGKWSEPIWVKNTSDNPDWTISESISFPTISDNSWSSINTTIYNPAITIDSASVKKLIDQGYKKIRPLYVQPTLSDRHIICQGLVNNTIGFVGNRQNNGGAWSFSDFRMRPLFNTNTSDAQFFTVGGAYSPNPSISTSYDVGWYDEAITNIKTPNTTSGINDDRKFFRDYTTVNMFSPDFFYNNADYVNIITGANKLNVKYIIKRTGYNSNNSLTVTGDGSNSPMAKNGVSGNYNYPGATSTVEPWFLANTGLSGGDQTLYTAWSPYSLHLKHSSGTLINQKIQSEHIGTFEYWSIVHKMENDRLYDINSPIGINEESDLLSYNTNTGDNGGSIVYSSGMNYDYVWEDMVLPVIKGGSQTMWSTEGLSPVTIKYKTSPHILFSFKDKALPLLTSTGDTTKTKEVFWRDADHPITYDCINYSETDMVHSYICELTKDVFNQYGGIEQEAFLNNQFIPCGDSVKITQGSPATIVLDGGDTYLCRFEYFQSYPYTIEDITTVTNVVSFMCESFYNTDGRYDNNRYTTNVVPLLPFNTNKSNDIYTQKNNTFTYNKLDEDIFSQTVFPHTITWSLNKQSSSVIDTWTSMNFSNVLDLDGTKGPLNKLEVFNNEIISFQDKGTANILFNSRVQIPTSDGVPIEITNNYKVSGYRYISDVIGCKNKKTINKSKYGIYFMDDINKNINIYNGQIKDLSLSLGFREWSRKNIPSTKWITYIDNQRGDVYFNNSSTILNYSEELNHMISFLPDYKQALYMFNFGDKFLSIRYNNNTSKIYYNFEGKYNEIYDQQVESYITYLVNPDVDLNKIFNVIEFVGDSFDHGGSYIPNKTLDYVEAWSEFQKGESDLYVNKNLMKKFRKWRANIPRQSNSINRMNNPWLFLKVYFNKNHDNNYRFVLHDLIVFYTI